MKMTIEMKMKQEPAMPVIQGLISLQSLMGRSADARGKGLGTRCGTVTRGRTFRYYMVQGDCFRCGSDSGSAMCHTCVTRVSACVGLGAIDRRVC